MSRYTPQTIEPKWQEYWQDHKTFKVSTNHSKPKFYVLDMFPYPSGDGLHVGHPKGYVATDTLARYKRMSGFNVLHPMGWDAFGLPAEQHAIRTGQHPRKTTVKNVANFKRQIQSLGLSIDWDREVDTTDPKYVRWTQWIFCKLYEKGLAYEAEVPVNWCPALGTVLANEEVRDGKSEIGGHPVVRMPLRQWMLRITAYAERLLEDLESLDWPEPIKKMQREWIGRSEGAEITFDILNHPDKKITVFTTRPDTLFGATYMVLAPEHPLIEKMTTPDAHEAVERYREETGRKSERTRLLEAQKKTGVFTGAYAIHPVNGKPIPIWIADYVLIGYGTGAIMAVPGHDPRDYAFAKTFDLPIQEVVSGGDLSKEAYADEGISINSDFLNGLPTPQAKKRMITWLEENGKGKHSITYKLRDWLFSRQRYWGEPFPILHLADGSLKLVPETHLPVLLPELDDFKPSGDFQAPLARVKSWIETTDPETGKPAMRDTNTMPQWAGSCWYYLRFCDAQNPNEAWSKEAERYWMPIDLYVGGAEHAVLHLLYARFWHKVLYDLGLTSTKEPFLKLINQGMILGKSYRCFQAVEQSPSPLIYSVNEVCYEGETLLHVQTKKELKACWIPPDQVRWENNVPYHPKFDVVLEEVTEKMSKSRGNVVNPDQVIATYGADSMRLYEMFLGPLDRSVPWSTESIMGVYRFLQRAHRLVMSEDQESIRDFPKTEGTLAQQKLLAKTIDTVTQDLERMEFNTAISALMVFVRDIEKDEPLPKHMAETFVLLLSPFAPHLSEELWQALGHPETLAYEPWPKANPALLIEETIEIVVQVNGKVRDQIAVSKDASKEEIEKIALNSDRIKKYIEGKPPKKIIVVPQRLINIVV